MFSAVKKFVSRYVIFSKSSKGFKSRNDAGWRVYARRFEYNEDINLWCIEWRFFGFNNILPPTERSMRFRDWDAKRRDGEKYANPNQLPTRGRNDSHLNIRYRYLAYRHGRNPFSSDYWMYERKF